MSAADKSAEARDAVPPDMTVSAAMVVASASEKIGERGGGGGCGGGSRGGPKSLPAPSCRSLPAAAAATAAANVDWQTSDEFSVDTSSLPPAPPSAATWPTAASVLSLRSSAEVAVGRSNPLSRLAVQLRSLDARGVAEVAPTGQATRLDNAAAAAETAVAATPPYRPLYCDSGLEYAIYRSLPMRNELDQYLEIAAKRRRKSRVSFVETCFPAQHDWTGRQATRRASWPSVGQPPPPPLPLQHRVAVSTRPLPPMHSPAALPSLGFARRSGPAAAVSVGGRAGGVVPRPQQQHPLPVRMTRLSTFAEIERQKTMTYDLHTKLKAMLADK